MIALTITDIRKFMAAFLRGTLLDEYALVEAQIRTFCTFSIDGKYEAAFEGEGKGEEGGGTAGEARPQYVRFARLKEHCFSIIKGRRTPLFFKFVFFCPDEEVAGLLKEADTGIAASQVQGLCLTLRYDGTRLLLTTGTSLKVFSMDKGLDRAWDAAVRKLLEAHEISFLEA